jgi:ABC-type amino acid transport system permease subunit
MDIFYGPQIYKYLRSFLVTLSIRFSSVSLYISSVFPRVLLQSFQNTPLLAFSLMVSFYFSPSAYTQDGLSPSPFLLNIYIERALRSRRRISIESSLVHIDILRISHE